MRKYTIIYIFVMMSVQPMQRIDDPIADIRFKEIRRTTFNVKKVENAKTLYSLRAVKRHDDKYVINEALKGWTLYDVQINKKYYDLDSLWIELIGKDK